jgi:thiamine-monophosphate kinase
VNELDFIAALRGLPLHPGAGGLDDDCALIEFGGETLVLTHDMIVEGVHYVPGDDPFNVAWRLIATNLSDLAAKGAEPIGVLVGASLIGRMPRFVEGLRAVLEEYRVPLLGGDTVSGDKGASFGCTAIGRGTCRPVPRRSGALPGDRIVLAGTIGAACLGYQAVENGVDAPDVVPAFLRPVPLLAEGRLLAPHAHAMMDVSDGLLLDAARMARASGVTLALDSAALAPAIARSDALSPLDWQEAASWGDDYALLAALPPEVDCSALPGRVIGSVMSAGDAPLLVDGEAPEGTLGYEHR